MGEWRKIGTFTFRAAGIKPERHEGGSMAMAQFDSINLDIQDKRHSNFLSFCLTILDALDAVYCKGTEVRVNFPGLSCRIKECGPWKIMKMWSAEFAWNGKVFIEFSHPPDGENIRIEHRSRKKSYVDVINFIHAASMIRMRAHTAMHTIIEESHEYSGGLLKLFDS